MTFLQRISASALALTLGVASAAAVPQGSAAPGDGLVIQVQDDCHSDVRRHFLPNYGRVWHRHRPNCRPLLVEPDDDDDDDEALDCHRDMRRHYLRDYGGRVTHRHVGSRCRVILDDDDEVRDCHRDVQRHFLREYGGDVAHRHVGPACRIRTFRPSDDPDSGRNCLRLGPILYCEN